MPRTTSARKTRKAIAAKKGPASFPCCYQAPDYERKVTYEEWQPPKKYKVILHFTIGPWLYRVATVKDLGCGGGWPIKGMCCEDKHIIYLDRDLAGIMFLETLFHELAHAYEFTFGRAAGLEGFANQMSSFAIDMTRQYAKQVCAQEGRAA